jgi:hypothetical protein
MAALNGLQGVNGQLPHPFIVWKNALDVSFFDLPRMVFHVSRTINMETVSESLETG